MRTYFWIAVGGALGSVGRYWFSGVIGRHFGETFPFGTLIVNITGCFVIGIFATLTDTDGTVMVSPTLRQFFMIGICGGYTTFSSFSLQTLNLTRQGEWLRAGENVVGSVALCLFAVWLGHVTAAAFNGMKGH